MAQKIKKGDKVIMLAGKDKGKSGDVVRILPKVGRAYVQGINLVRRHTKPSRTNQGGIIPKEASVNLSNVALVDPKDGKATRVGFQIDDKGKKVRIAKRSGAVIV